LQLTELVVTNSVGGRQVAAPTMPRWFWLWL